MVGIFYFGKVEKMKYRISKQVRYIKYSDDFEKVINGVLAEVSDPKITYLEHAAIVEFTTEVYIPETIAEEAEVNGCAHECQECPYFSESNDKRMKWHKCTLKDKKVLKTSFCCDEFYERRLNEKREKIPKIIKGNQKPWLNNRADRRRGVEMLI